MKEESLLNNQAIKELLDASSDGILAFDVECRYTAWNRAMERISGLRSNEVLGRCAFDIFPFLKETGEDRYFYEALQGRSAVSEMRRYFVPETGRNGFFHGHYSPLHNETGEVIGGVAVIRDVTEHRKAEEALRASEERYRAFIANSSEGIWRFELEQPVSVELSAEEQIELFYRYGYLAECNDAMARMYGFEHADEITGARLGDLLVRLDPQNDAYLRAFIRSGYRLLNADSVETNREGRRKFFSNNLIGVVEDAMIMRAWGTQRDVTESKVAEAQLRENEARFRAISDASPLGLYVTDAGGDCVYTNRAYQQISGLSFEEALGKGWSGAVHPDDRERVFSTWYEFAQNPAIFDSEHRFLRPDGTEVLTHVTAAPITDGQKVTGYIGTVENITERKRAEEALRESEENYRSLLENANDIIYSHDLEGNYLTINRAGEELMGYTREEILGGLNISQIVAPEHLELARRMIAEKIGGAGPTIYEIDIISRDGRRLTLEVSTRISYKDGRAVAVEGVARDVTERKRIREELERSQQRLALALEAGNIGTFDWDITTNELLWTVQLETMFGIHPGGFGGTFENWRERLHKKDLARTESEIAEAIDSKADTWQTEYRMYRADTGEMRWIDARARFYYDQQGRPLRMIGINIDITERKQAEQERERLLKREQTARAQAEEANRLKDEFLATVSHELRTPLTSILGWSRILRGGMLDEKSAANALLTIERNARAQSQIVDDLLDVSRIITGKLRLDVLPIDPTAAIDAAIEALRPAAEAKAVRIQKVLATGAELIYADPARLQQIIWNLLSNAVKFTPNGGQVTVSFRRIDSHIEIVVSDTGKGIDREFLPFVFERFSQADMSTTRKHGGLGLGLAIVRHLAELHGGTVHAESGGEGTGAIFIVTLPFMPAGKIEKASSQKASEHVGGESIEAGTARLDGLSVMVVDDEIDTLEFLRVALSLAGAKVTTSVSADEALELLKELRPDLLVCDISMPGADGYDLIRRVRALSPERGGTTPAIALTAYARDEDRARAIKAGYQVHVAKPVEPNDLVTVLYRLSERAGAS